MPTFFLSLRLLFRTVSSTSSAFSAPLSISINKISLRKAPFIVLPGIYGFLVSGSCLKSRKELIRFYRGLVSAIFLPSRRFLKSSLGI